MSELVEARSLRLKFGFPSNRLLKAGVPAVFGHADMAGRCSSWVRLAAGCRQKMRSAAAGARRRAQGVSPCYSDGSGGVR